MVRFNPFQKPLDEIETADLVCLQEAAEGWYVEYKGPLPDLSSMAKSISAFANHYGGWIAYGVNESPDGSRTAGEFPGLSDKHILKAEERLTKAAATYVFPPPFFQHRVFRGPCAEIGLREGRAILLVLVPPGGNPPYVHGGGRIYRRVADASDPKHETDRSTLDLLWERGRRRRDRLAERLNAKPELSQGEAETSFMRVFLLPDPLGDRVYRSSIPFSEFARIVGSADDGGAGLPFDNVYSMPDGFIARQARNNNPYNELLSLKYHRDRSALLTVPLNSGGIEWGSPVFQKYRWAEELGQLRLEAGLEATFVDLNMLWYILSLMLRKYELLLTEEQHQGTVFGKVSLDGIWRRAPFLDSQSYVDFVKRFGFPVVQQSHAFVPPGTSPESLFEIDLLSPKAQEEGESVVLRHSAAGVIWGLICSALGVPHETVIESAIDVPAAFSRATGIPVGSD